MICQQRGPFKDVPGRGKKYGALVAQINVHTGLILQLMNELGIHASTGCGQSLKCRRCLQRKVSQHAGCGVRCFLSRFSALDYQDGGATLPQRDREGKPDDPTADDDDVPGPHSGIVEDKLVGAGLSLESSQVVQDLRLAPVNRPDKLTAQNALAIDDVGLGKSEGPVKVVTLLVGIADGQQVYVVVLEKFLVSALVDVDADSQHFYSLALHFLLHLHQGRHLIHARGAPGGPEIQHHNLAPKLGQANLAIAVLD